MKIKYFDCKEKPSCNIKVPMNLEKLRADTEIGKEIKDMGAFYKAMDNDLASFDKEMGIVCRCKSGNCCEHFVPSLTPLEAQYLAYVIIRDGKEEDVLSRLSAYGPRSGVCPLYNKEGNFHCSLYLGRGLICRLFGAACFVDKEGRGIFHSCKWNSDKKSFDEKVLEGKKIPIMGDYGRALGSMEGNEQDAEAINLALPKAIEKIKLVLSLIDKDSEYNK